MKINFSALNSLFLTLCDGLQPRFRAICFMVSIIGAIITIYIIDPSLSDIVGFFGVQCSDPVIDKPLPLECVRESR